MDGVQFFCNLLADFLTADIHEGSQVGEGNALSAVLAGGYLGDNLSGNVAGGGKAVGLFDQGSADNGSVLQHVL